MKHKKAYGILSAYPVDLSQDAPGVAAVPSDTLVWHYDWRYQTYGNLRTSSPQAPDRLNTGDLVRVFNTVSKGTVKWEGFVQLDYNHPENWRYNSFGLQRDMSGSAWSSMFDRQLPAKLVRKDGTVIFGALDPHSDQGIEGIAWSVHAYGKTDYDGQIMLENGDHLSVYSSVRDGNVEWEGTVSFGPAALTKIGFMSALREVRHMDAEKWLDLSWQCRPVIVTPK